MGRFLSRCILVALLLAVGIALYSADRDFFGDRKFSLQHRQERVRDRLAQQGVALLYTADDPPGLNWANGHPARIAGTRAVEGRFGTALEFDGGRRTFVKLPLLWSDLGPTFTLSLWVNLNPASVDQEILFTRMEHVMGLKLDRGHLAFFSSPETSLQAAEYAFTNYGRFVHIAAVVDARAGRTRLYEDGVLKSDFTGKPFELDSGPIQIGAATTILIAEPILGAVDDVVILRRALSDSEVADWAHASEPAIERLADTELAKLRRTEILRKSYSHFLKLVDRLNPALHASTIRKAPLPEINLILSKNDTRFFLKADRQSRKNGRRTTKSAQPRRVDILANKHGYSGFLRLDGSDGAYPESTRRSYILEPQEGETVLGLRRIRLQPPEVAGWLAPLLETRVAQELNLPSVSNGFCRLMINGEFVGIYHYEDYAHFGVPPGETSGRLQGSPPRGSWHKLGTTQAPRMDRARLIELCDETDHTYRKLLRADYTSPLSSREIIAKIRANKRDLKELPLDESSRSSPAAEALAALSAWQTLGTNPAPFFILHDLALPSNTPDGTPLLWTSSRPDLISTDGLVSRPATNSPQHVILTAQLANTPGDAPTHSLEYRVMPRNRQMPAVFLWAATPLDRLRRSDCAMDYYPAGDDTHVQRHFAAQDERAGISLRGHTSLNQLKRSFSVRLSEPHGWWGTTNETKIRLVNPWRDPTLLHNWFFYSRFAAFADRPDRLRVGMPVTWVEIFANGNYFGLYEASPSMRAEWLQFPQFDPADPDPALLYKAQGASPSLTPDGNYLMRQLEPSRRNGEFVEPELDLHRLIMEAPKSQFADEIGKRLDLDNATDFLLLLEFSENYNGYPYQYAIHDLLARPQGADSKFFFIPYDFDNTYGHLRYPIYHSIVFTRLMKEVPGYTNQLAARWRELRQSALDLDTMEREIRAREKDLAGYVEWDDTRWKRYSDNPYENRVANFIGHIRRRVAELDARYQAARPSQ